MDIQNTIISAKVVIESLVALLENEDVDISSIKFKVGSQEEGYESEDVSFESLINLTMKGLEEAKNQAVPEGFVLIDNSELESLKSDNEHFTKSCIDWTDRAYKQRAKIEQIKNEAERFKQSGTHLDLSRFLDNLIEFSTFKHDEEFEGFVLVPKCKSESFSEKLDDYLENLWQSSSAFDDGFVSVDEINHDKIWSLVIEAQEQKG